MGYFDSGHPTLLADPVTAKDHVRGLASAPVTLVEYGDFACPSCRQAHALLSTLVDRSPQVRLVFRANPRAHVFPAAPLAAEAAEAAAVQGKYWEMHDLLFKNQDSLSPASISRMAAELNLDVGRFADELRTGAHWQSVHEQEISGWHSHVLSTPTFFINGVRFDDSIDALPAAISRVAREASENTRLFREARIETTTAARAVSLAIGPHNIVADLSPDDRGSDSGPSPYDLLLAALGSCTAMTVKWAAEREHLPVTRAVVRISQSRTPSGHIFRRSIEVDGDLTDEQKARLLGAAEHSPVARTLRGEITVDTRLIIDRTVDEAGEESFPASDPPAWTSGRP